MRKKIALQLLIRDDVIASEARQSRLFMSRQ
jgi:hypothetical protein